MIVTIASRAGFSGKIEDSVSSVGVAELLHVWLTHCMTKRQQSESTSHDLLMPLIDSLAQDERDKHSQKRSTHLSPLLEPAHSSCFLHATLQIRTAIHKEPQQVFE